MAVLRDGFHNRKRGGEWEGERERERERKCTYIYIYNEWKCCWWHPIYINMPVNRRLARWEEGRRNIVAGLCDRQGCGWTKKRGVRDVWSACVLMRLTDFVVSQPTWMAVCVIGVVGPVYVWPIKRAFSGLGGQPASCDITSKQTSGDNLRQCGHCGRSFVGAETLHPEK